MPERYSATRHRVIVTGVKPSGLSNQPLSKFGIDPPVARFIGINWNFAVCPAVAGARFAIPARAVA
jgi:hypothetical protein